ncbi:non-ribosomal peptide synthetase [Jongsikchunia kroppenstedtii]|uniref:non-ribosomal peptide synthetase n=1 Tax=Jongsikchunia kroppenstedtii TaxID=1121721 RepID=UPI0003721686|nr:non-ribosomal peptide synthetase [Jongsikchunia kroppenstedtii]
MISKDQIRDDVASLLDVPAHTIDYTDDLVRHGVHSLLVIKLTSMWRRQGHRVRSSQLSEEPTIEAWARLLGGSSAPQAAPEPAAAPAPEAAETTGTEEEFGLATMQHAYWVGRQDGQALGGVAAHLFAEFDGAGVDADRLERAVNQVVARHDMLRAAFDDTGRQRILPQPPRPVFSVVDLREATGDLDIELERTRDRMSHQLLDTASGSVVEFVLTLLPDGRHRLHLDVDMLAADAMSYRKVLDDLATAYETDAPLQAIGYTFREYLAEKGDHVSPEEYATAKQWWEAKEPTLPDTPTLPSIPEDRRAEPDRSVRYHHQLGPAEKDRLYAIAYDNGITPAVTFAAVFSEVIARWSTHQRFLLNVPLFNREPVHTNIDEVVGDFTNSVLIDADATHTESMIERGRRLQKELHDCAGHAAYEGLDVLRDLGRIRGSAVTPSLVFTSGLGFGELFSDRVRGLFGEPVWILSQGPQVDLDAQVVELDGGLLVNWDVRRDALPGGVMDAMFTEFRSLLDGLVRPDADWNAALSIELPPAQRTVRDRVTSTTSSNIVPRSLHAAFFTRAEQEPERTALVTADGQELSYATVAEQARSLAGALAAAGVGRGDTVAVIMPKGHQQVIAVLGVLAGGAAYLPIGTDQPASRRDAILARGQVRAVIAPQSDGLPDSVVPVIYDDAVAGPAIGQVVVPDPDELAYVLFTSGSTGEPKGVEVSHRAAANTVDAIAEEFALIADDRTIGLSALEFDLSVFDMFSPLSLGGALVCINADQTRDAQAWAAQIAAHRVSVLNAAPGLIGMLLDTATTEQLQSLRTVVTGGDRVNPELGRRARKAVSGLRFAGLGGTTETAIHSTIYEVTDDFPADWATVPYGRPMAGVHCRVVNDRGEDTPDWVIGELWIGGTSVADGYRGDPERTQDRFVTVDSVRWYRTGDLARYLPDGTIEFIGRADHQVKIRGYRVELGEIEAAARSLADVREAVAAVVADRLVLAVVSADGASIQADEVSATLGNLVPDYMIPEVVHVIDEIPLTSNGKVDRAAVLAELQRAVAGTTPHEYVAPETAVEAAVAYIAEQVLGVERLGVTTDFFDAGANSILATTFVANVRGLLAVEGVGITAVFKARTVRGFAALLAEREQVPGQLTQVATILLEVAGVPAPASELAGAAAQ